jgi:hypothetical protein
MRKTIMAAIVAFMCLGFVQQASSALYVEYYRDNLFLGLAHHRIACLTDWNTIQSSQDYDGFTNTRYCNAGATAASVPNASWFDYNNASSKAQLDNCGTVANNTYGTPNYAPSSNTCSYNIATNCNSDCWIRKFSQCQGKQVSIASPCF